MGRCPARIHLSTSPNAQISHWIGNVRFYLKEYYPSLFRLIESDFIAATILISMGAMLGKLSPIQYLIMALIEVPVAIGIEHIVVQNLNVISSHRNHVHGLFSGQ